MQFNAAGGSGFNETITSTHFYAVHGEDGNNGAVSYDTGGDQAQGTSYQRISQPVGADNDQSLSGTIYLFDPSNTTFVKHFISNVQYAYPTDQTQKLGMLKKIILFCKTMDQVIIFILGMYLV